MRASVFTVLFISVGCALSAPIQSHDAISESVLPTLASRTPAVTEPLNIDTQFAIFREKNPTAIKLMVHGAKGKIAGGELDPVYKVNPGGKRIMIRKITLNKEFTSAMISTEMQYLKEANSLISWFDETAPDQVFYIVIRCPYDYMSESEVLRKYPTLDSKELREKQRDLILKQQNINVGVRPEDYVYHDTSHTRLIMAVRV